MKKLRAGLCAAAVGSLFAAVPVAQPASAAGTFSCAGNSGKAYVLGIGAATGEVGALWSYPYGTPSSDSSGALSARVKIGTSGWQVFSAIRAGKDGFLWAFKTDGSLVYYDWNVGPTSTTWAVANTPPTLPAGVTIATAPWKAYATSTYRGRIAVDASNSILVLGTDGRIRKYSYSTSTKTWPVWNKVVANVGTSYDMLWASDTNTLYARKTDGSFTRLRVDPGSDRVVQRFDGGGNGWGAFKYVSSAGGDTMYTVATAGGMKRYRFDDDAGALLPSLVLGTGSGWPNYLDFTVVGNTCVRSYPAEATTASTLVDAPLEAAGAQTASTVGVALANAVGTLQFATFDPMAQTAGSLTWTANNDGDTVTGKPALTTDAADRFHLFSHTTTGLTKEKSQASPGTGVALGGLTGHGGVLSGPTDAEKLSDGTTVLAATDSLGVVWVRQEYGGAWTTWRQAATGAAPSAPVTVTATSPGAAALTYPTASHAVATVAVTNGVTVGTPVVLAAPGSGTSGRVASMAYSGGALRLVATDSRGALHSISQDLATKAWGTWRTLSGDGTTRGEPAVVLSPVSSRVQVLVRQADDTLGILSEVSQGSGTFTSLAAVPGGPTATLTSSPTTYTFTDPNNGTPVRRWGVVAYDIDRTVWTFNALPGTPSPTGRTAGGTEDTLVARSLGTAPTR